jgi:hypothetical protein
MSLEAALSTALKSDATLAALHGGRVYHVVIPQGIAGDCLVCQEISGIEAVTTDGQTGLIDARWQITLLAATHARAVALRDAVMAFARGGLCAALAGIDAQAVVIANRGDVSALNDQAEQLSRYGKFVDLTISYSE